MFIEEIEREERKANFIKKAIAKYEDKFDYSKVKYINNSTKVIIICQKHGEFLKTPAKHLIHKYSCPKCALEGYSKSVRMDKTDFIKQATKIYNNKYTYDKVVIKKRIDKIKIYCTEHKIYFEQMLVTHLQGKIGCPQCLTQKKKDYNHKIFKQNFIEKFTQKYGTHYDFSKVEYINNTTPVTVKCLKHNIEFQQRHANIRKSSVCSCPLCKKETKLHKPKKSSSQIVN